MQLGQGSLGYSLRNKPSGAPFPANAAYNGLSIDPVTGQIVLGQDIGDGANPAALISNREIPLSGNDLHFNRAIDFGLGQPTEQGNIIANLLFGPPGGSYQFVVRGSENDGVSNALEFIITKHGLYFFDDVNAANFNILTADNTSLFSDNGLDLTPPLYRIGDVNNVQNGTTQSIDDALQTVAINDGLGNRFFEIDMPNGTWKLGDIDGLTTGSLIQIFDPSFLVSMNARDGLGANAGLGAQADTLGVNVYANMIVQDGVNPSVEFRIDKQTGQLNYDSNAYFIADFSNMNFSLGDLPGFNNGTSFNIDDTTGVFSFDNTALTSKININGIDGFTGTVSPVNSITVNGGIVTAVS